MAKHKVKFTIPERELGKSDIEFKVRRDGKVFGTLKISKGNIVWRPKDAQKGYRVAWLELDAHAKKMNHKER